MVGKGYETAGMMEVSVDAGIGKDSETADMENVSGDSGIEKGPETAGMTEVSVDAGIGKDTETAGMEKVSGDTASAKGFNGTEKMSISVNGNEISLKEGKSQYIFVDVFNYIDFDLTKPMGNIILRLNGRQAAFTDAIRPGDNIEIYWQK